MTAFIADLSPAFLISYVALWLLLMTQSVLLFVLYRHFGLISMGTFDGVQRDGLSVGEETPAIDGVTADGIDTRWEPGRSEPTVLLFASPECEPCADAIPYFEEVHRSGVPVGAIVPGSAEAAQQLKDKFHPSFPYVAEEGARIFDRFRVRVTPFAFVVGRDQRVLAKGLPSSPALISQLLASAGFEDAAARVAAVAEDRARLMASP